MTVFINKGDAPMSVRQAVKRGLRHFNAEKQQHEREQGIVEGSAEYTAWANQWIADNIVNAANNLFNHQLANYKAAVARLEQYLVAEGRPEVTEMQEAFDENGMPLFDEATGEPIMESVVVQSAIDPLDAQVEENVYDEETGEITGTVMVDNPAIVQDVAERTAAQQVIDSTPQEVKDFA